MSWTTADLCDQFSSELQIAEPLFQNYGGRLAFCGQVATIKAHEDNSLVRTLLTEPGAGRVLVVDGGGSLRCAMLGDQLAMLAVQHGWSGVVLNACLRDSVAIAALDLGVKALATHPLRSVKLETGQRDLIVQFGGVTFRPGTFLYADSDGLIVSARSLLEPGS